MRIAALALVAAGVLLTAGGGTWFPTSFDFAIALRPGWHVTVFPWPFIGLLVLTSGVAALLASFHWR
jgi:hypothetical protein